MESATATEVPPKKTKYKQNLNLHVAECIRQFELPRQYPSTVTQLRLAKPGSEKNIVQVPANNMQNIISALPLSGKMKFIPNKEVSISENMQKLILKRPDGKDLGEVKLVMPKSDEKLQTKVITMSKVGQNEKPISWTIKSQTPSESNKPKVKTVTKIVDGSICREENLKELGKKSPQMKVQIVNQNSTNSNILQNNCKILSNLKKLANLDGNDLSKQKFVLQNADGEIIKKFIIGNSNLKLDKQKVQSQLITLKKLTGSQQVLMMQKDNKLPIMKSINDKFISIKSNQIVTQGSTNNNKANTNGEQIVFKSALNGSIIRKRDSSSLQSLKISANKISRLEIDSDTQIIDDDSNIQVIDIEQSESTKPTNSNSNTALRKNIMVIVPSETAEELTVSSNSSDNNNKEVHKENNVSCEANIPYEDLGYEEYDRNTAKQASPTQGEKQSANITLNDTSKIVKNKNRSEDMGEEFDILKKAVLSVQDANLRAKALKALKDCGIKVKKTVPIKRPAPRKIINESGTQTEVFSLLKDDEFIQVTEEQEELVKIKQTRKVMKQPISSLSSNIGGVNRSFNTVKSQQDINQWKDDLDAILEKGFSGNKVVTGVKEALVRNKVTIAKELMKRLQMDFEAAKNHDDDGLLGIHRAVLKDDIKEVQRHLIILKAAKQSIDVCTYDDMTSLELAIEHEVNPQIVKILLNAGAQPVSSISLHDSALIIAARKSSTILPLLFNYINRSNRSLLDSKDSRGFAAIHYCAENGNLVGVTELLKHGADANLQEERSGRTALFYAVETKNGPQPQETYNEIAHKLLEHGAVSNIQTFSKHSVLSMIDEVKSHTLKVALNKAVNSF